MPHKKFPTVTHAALAVTVLLTVSGCVSATRTYTGDGGIGYSIDCSSNKLTWGRCFERAGEVCGSRGYEVLEKISEQGAGSIATGSFASSGTKHFRSLLIKCKGDQ